MISHTATAVLCALLAVAEVIVALPNEVPYKACEDMKAKGPGHRFAWPQDGKAPYDFVFEHKSILNTQTLDVTIRQKHNGKPFQAFMIQARDETSEFPLRPVGTFWPKDISTGRTVTCTNSYDTASHNSPEDKTTVTMTWTPPSGYEGKVTFYFTVAETKFVFWAHEKSAVITVKKPDD